MIRLFTAISLFVLAFFVQAVQPDPVYRETEVRNDRPRAFGEIFDPQEANPKLKDIFSAADKLAERRVGDVKRDAGFIHRFWREKKSILRDRYHIQWKSPADLNPAIDYGAYGQPIITEKERISAAQYLALQGYIGDEAVLGVWRVFEGKVYVATKDQITGRIRHYELTGIEDRWRLISVYFVEE